MKLKSSIVALTAMLVVTPVLAEEKRYDLDKIDTIDAGGAFNIVVKFGNKQSVTVVEPNGRFDNLEVTVKGGRLDLDYDGHWGWDEGESPRYTVKLTLQSLDEIELSGASRILVRDAKLDELEVDLSGATQAVISGTCDMLEADVSGASKFAGEDFLCEDIELDLSGAAQAAINATNAIDVETSGVSKLAIHGKAKNVAHESSGLANTVYIDK